VPTLWLRCLIFGVALVAPGALVEAALPKLNPAPQSSTLAGQFLIASPAMGDPRFRRTVILMVRHNKDGALGITINRPAGEKTLAHFGLLQNAIDIGVDLVDHRAGRGRWREHRIPPDHFEVRNA